MTKCGVIWESALEMWEEHHTWDGSGKVLWRKRHLSPTLKDGTLTGGDGREKNILIFPHSRWVAGFPGSRNSAVAWWWDNKVLSSQLWKQMDCVHKEQSFPLYFGEYSSRVGQANMLDPDMTSLLPPVFFLFLGEIGDTRLEGSQSGTFKITSTEKSKEQKLKIALSTLSVYSMTEKMPECYLFTLTKMYKLYLLGRHSQWKESH